MKDCCSLLAKKLTQMFVLQKRDPWQAATRPKHMKGAKTSVKSRTAKPQPQNCARATGSIEEHKQTIVGKEKEEESEEQRGKEREGGEGRVQARQRQRKTETHSTNARVRPTLKITSQSVAGALVQRMHFQGACKFNTEKLPVERKKKRVHRSWSSKAVLETAASGVHSRQAPVNELCGARFFIGVWVEIGHRTQDHSAHQRPI